MSESSPPALSSPGPDDDQQAAGLPLSRRQLLRIAAGLGTVSVVGLGARVWQNWDRPAGEGLQYLAPGEAELLDAMAEALFPPGGDPPLSGADAGITGYLDGVFGDMPDPTGDLLRLLLNSLDDWCRLTSGRRFAVLSLEARQQRLRNWADHPIPPLRSAVSSLLLFISAGYCGHPDVRRACGWVFPCGYER